MLSLPQQALRNTILSVLLYGGIFGILIVVEYLFPSLRGTLLPWTLPNGTLNSSFIIGIPAGLLGTAYVLTVRNPNNYLGFYIGIVMSVLLSIQLYLKETYDLVFLYIFVFIPFQVKSLITWRKQTRNPLPNASSLAPSFLSPRSFLWVQIIGLTILVLDYSINTLFFLQNAWTDQFLLKVASALLISTSVLANFLMINKKNDAWICWLLYSITGIILFMVLNNIFSVVMFVVMFAINLSAQIAWLKMTPSSDFGWMGKREWIDKIRARIHLLQTAGSSGVSQ